MKTIVTLDKGNQPYGFAQLDANGNLSSSVTASYALTASYAMNGGGGGVSGGSDSYIPVWSGSNGLTSSFLTQSGSVLRTTSSYDNGYPGIYIDLTNDVYGFGNIIGKPNNTANGIFFQTGTSYFNTSNGINSLIFELNSSANIIQTNGGNTGLKLDFTNDLYQFGNFTNSSITITGSQVEITGSELKFSGQTNFNNAVAVNDSNMNLTNSSSLNLTSGSSIFIDGGSLTVTNGGVTASLYGTASWAYNVVNATNIDTASFATTGSNNFNGNQTITGSLQVVGSLQVTDKIVNPNNPSYLEITSINTFPYTTLAEYNTNTTWDTPFTALVKVGTGIQRLYGGNNVDIASIFESNADVTSINDGGGVVTTIDAVGFADCYGLVFVNFPSITYIPNNVFRHCNELGIALLPKAVTAGDYAFTNTSIVDVSLPLLTSIGVHGFDNIVSLKTVSLPKLTSLPEDSFANCTALTTINLSSVTDLGGTPQDDGVFANITGNTITLTVPVAMQTIDSGSPDGDIVSLNANNTLTVNYI